MQRLEELPCMRTFTVRDGCLSLSGRPVPELVAEAGGTPVYLYDEAMLQTRLAELRGALPGDVAVHYAVKANPMPALLQCLADRVDGFDIASAGELERLLAIGVAPDRISFAGPGKRDDELAAAIAAGITLHIESAGELERVAELATRSEARPRVALRINPNFELKRSGMRMAGGPQPFGIDAECAPQLLQRMDALPVAFQGFHLFAGSQNLRTDLLIEALDPMFRLLGDLAAQAPEPVRQVTLGAGLGIPYFPGDQPVDLPAYARALATCLAQRPKSLQGTRIALELGRYLVGEAGVYITRVIDRKISRGQVYLITDGGMHHHLAASGNLGQVVRRNFPVAVANRMDAPAQETATVVGPLCTPLDRLAEQVELPTAGPGDLIAVFQSGAYGLTASPVHFLSHPLPRERLIPSNKEGSGHGHTR